jgi:hypothetical protein
VGKKAGIELCDIIMPGKVLDAINILGAASVGSTLTVVGAVSAPSIQLSSGAAAGKYLTCDASGNASWGTVDQEWGMKFNQSTSSADVVLLKTGSEAVVVLAAAATLTLPAIDADMQGRMYLVVNKHTAANQVMPNAANSIDSGVVGAGISLPGNGGKCMVAAGTSAEGWFTI